MNKLSRRARVVLIKFGKILPFIVCFIVLVSYCEGFIAMANEDYVVYDNALVLNKSLSWAIARHFEYNAFTILILLVISIATETCIWNKLAILYLAFQLLKKQYLIQVELDEAIVYCIIIINILICVTLITKAIILLFTNKKL